MVFLDSENDGHEDDEENLVFHYKRGSYRNLEDEKTRSLASGKTKNSPGLFRSLVNTRGNRMVFFTLVAVTIFTFLWGTFNSKENKGVLDGIAFNLEAFTYGEISDKVYSSLELKEAKSSKEKFPANLELEFYSINSDGQIAETKQELFIFDRKSPQRIRISFSNYDIAAVKCKIKTGEKDLELSCSIEKK